MAEENYVGPVVEKKNKRTWREDVGSVMTFLNLRKGNRQKTAMETRMKKTTCI